MMSRSERVPALSRQRPSGKTSAEGTAFSSIFLLALWRVRTTGWLLGITGLGIIAAVILLCTVPMYSQVTWTAGLRGVLTSSSENSDIVVRSTSFKISMPAVSQVTQHLNREFDRYLKPYLKPAQFSLTTQTLPITTITPDPNGPSFVPQGQRYALVIIGTATDQAGSHVQLLQGRLPQSASGALEIAITPDMASQMGLHTGSIITAQLGFRNGAYQNIIRTLSLHVVGIFSPHTTDNFWHGEDFQRYAPSDTLTIYRGMVANTVLLSTLDHICSDPQLNDYVFQEHPSLNWYFSLNPPGIAINDLSAILSGINTIKTDNANNAELEQSPLIEETQTYLPSPQLQQYQDLIPVARLPVLCLLALMFGLLLFFVTIMTDILVERQSDTIAILRSRGASPLQVFGALMTQGGVLAVVTLIVGPLLALLLTIFLAQRTLSVADQSALNIITQHPITALLSQSAYPLIAIGAALLAMMLSFAQTLRLDVLSLRRESARTTRRPLWQRLYLDIVVAIVALIGFGIAEYVANAGVLDTRSALLLLSPLTLLGALCLFLASLLLMLRLFPALLRYGAAFTARSRGAAALLALAQMSRTPRQALRMTLLLALAISFGLFTLICTASQHQRVLDVAAFQSGADFSGSIPLNRTITTSPSNITNAYSSIPGVKAASVGYTNSAIAGNTLQGMSVDFKAVDADTFARTAYWSPRYSSESLQSLMQRLASQRSFATRERLVPAIVDMNGWNALHLHPGAHFTLNFSLSDYADLINFVVVGQVQHVPTPNSSLGPAILVDYQSFAAVYREGYGVGGKFLVLVNTVWLRTADDPASLASVRKAITTGGFALDAIYDRRAIIDSLYHEPLYLTLTGTLAFGAATALLLALMGNLLASWMSVRSRLTSFTVLRALGASARQVVTTLSCEQGIIYAVAIVLGILFGSLFSYLVVPVLVFTSAIRAGALDDTAGRVFLSQSVPPIQIIVPPSLALAFGVLVAVCVITFIAMLNVISRPSISQTLRLNED